MRRHALLTAIDGRGARTLEDRLRDLESTIDGLEMQELDAQDTMRARHHKKAPPTPEE